MSSWRKRWRSKIKREINREINPDAVPPTGSVPVLPGINIYSSQRAARVCSLEQQIETCKKFLEFLDVAYKRGYAVELFIAVDGQIAPSSMMFGPKMKPLLKYIAESAAGWKLVYQEELDGLIGYQPLGKPKSFGREDPDHPDHRRFDASGWE